MRRFIAVILIAAAGLALVMALAEPFRLLLKRLGGDTSNLWLIPKSTVSVAYVLDEGRWTSFVIPPGKESFRILTNAAVPSAEHLSIGEEVAYSLHYRITDEKGAVLAERDYHHRTKLTLFTDPEAGADYTAYFLLSGDRQPLDGRIMMLDLTEFKGAARIDIRSGPGDGKVKEVLLRLYAREKNPEYKFRRLWLSMTDYQRQRLASGNVYPSDLLTEEEQKNILRNLWQPLGPVGVMDEGYRAVDLYVVKETEDGEPENPVLPAGLFVEKGFRGIIPVPKEGGTVRLEFIETSGGDQPRAQVVLRWYGKKAFARSSHTINLSGGKALFTRAFGGGLIEVSPSTDVVVRATLLVGGKETDITPETLYLRAFMTDKDRPVEFEINHEGAMPTPFRVDLRGITDGEGQSAAGSAAAATFTLLGPDGRVVREGSIPLNRQVSLYERPAAVAGTMRTSEPVSYYFSLPTAVKRMRLSSPGPVLVTGYNRPPGLVRELTVPDDYYVPYLRDERQPSWFPLKPVGYERLYGENRTVLLTVQFRPPADVPDLLQGRYQWEDFHPRGRWLARPILTEWEDPGFFRPEVSPSLFRPVPPGTELTLDFVTLPGLRTVAPKIVYSRKEAEPSSIRTYIDGVLHDERRIPGKRGEIVLPPLGTGKHRVRIESPGGAGLYLSNTGPGDGSLLMRLANRIGKEDLEFLYEKKTDDEEVLSARLHVPVPAAGTTALNVVIAGPPRSGPGPWTGWTPLQRKYIITPGQGSPLPVLNVQREEIDRGQVFFIPLGRDLPRGHYRVRFSMTGRPEGYLVFYRTTPGLAVKRDIVPEMKERQVVTHE